MISEAEAIGKAAASASLVYGFLNVVASRIVNILNSIRSPCLVLSKNVATYVHSKHIHSNVDKKKSYVEMYFAHYILCHNYSC